jgi:hypothetical protein
MRRRGMPAIKLKDKPVEQLDKNIEKPVVKKKLKINDSDDKIVSKSNIDN